MPEAPLHTGHRLPGPVVAVVGPTGVGKTAAGEEIALRLGGEIVSADSMQVYRGMDVGTAKALPEQRRVPYHCVDLVDPGTPYSAALFQSDARAAIDTLLERARTPVVVGGTGLYVRAALDEMSFPRGMAASPAREQLERLADVLGPQGIHAYLAERDPESAAMIHPNNVRRVIRAIEMLESDGVPYSEQAAGFAQRRSSYETVYIGLTMDRARLYGRIDARVDAMIASGLLDEVRGLLEIGYREALTATQAIGYKEFVPVIDGTAPLAEAIESVKLSSRRYAKRQLTWFRGDPRITWLDVADLSPGDAADAAWRLVESALHTA
ncbi:MAG: tRNA (adenosine(37)-N6)-dimethylallyltransferase MiaA [Coriobacteriia bacterium]|nr:tRNA (adenosine(37)-N6)-dimethylallyltransferase MiaA [Coriobacteriia bacterium]